MNLDFRRYRSDTIESLARAIRDSARDGQGIALTSHEVELLDAELRQVSHERRVAFARSVGAPSPEVAADEAPGQPASTGPGAGFADNKSAR